MSLCLVNLQKMYVLFHTKRFSVVPNDTLSNYLIYALTTQRLDSFDTFHCIESWLLLIFKEHSKSSWEILVGQKFTLYVIWQYFMIVKFR